MTGRPRRADILTPLWYEALASPLGIAVTVTGRPRESVATNLYRCREQAADAALRSVSIVIPPNQPNTLWLVRRAESTDAPNS